MKRVFDLVLVLCLSIPTVAASGLIALLIWRIDRANPLFIQTRVGCGGRPFRLVKFRTMSPECPDLPSHEASAQLVTSIGSYLRRFKLDELPQLWNVLRGEMSFVGPRPCLPSQRELIEERAARGVLDLVPGITGPSQVRGFDMSRPRQLAEHDAAYLGRWSISNDVAILLATVTGSGRGDAIRDRDID